MTTWQKFITDLKQRLLKFDALRGLILLALGIAIALTAYYVEQHVILVASIGVGIFLTVEGLRRITKNPIKEQIAIDLAKAKHWAESELGYDPTGVTAPPAAAQVVAPPVVVQPVVVATAAPTQTPVAAAIATALAATNKSS